MKRKLFIAVTLLAVVVLACNKEKQTTVPQSTSAVSQSTSQNHHSGARLGDSSCLFISQSDANQMIGSYIYSVNNDPNNTVNNPDLHALIVNADSLRAYLTNPNIKSVKLIYAHTMSYINAGNYGKNAGYSANAMTMVIAGVDAQGNYVYFGQLQRVLDHCSPCPSNCPNGTAGNDLLQ